MAARVDEKRLREALHGVLGKAGTVRTLTLLVRLVNEELERRGATNRVGPTRLRRIAATAPGVRVQIHARRGDADRPQKKCPVCGGHLRRVENRTLHGERVTMEARCRACPYWTGRHRRVPTRYTYRLKRK